VIAKAIFGTVTTIFGRAVDVQVEFHRVRNETAGMRTVVTQDRVEDAFGRAVNP